MRSKLENPETETDLKNWMEVNCYNFNNYCIGGNVIHDGHGIEKSGELYCWYYIERGRKEIIKSFKSEKEIITYAFKKIKSDKWRIHIV